VKRKYVVFRVGDGQFGIALEEVVKVVRFENVVDVPTAPAYVEGVLNLGGEVVPILNLRMRLSVPRLGVNRQHRVIVVERDLRRFGLLVDAVRDILELDEESIITEAIAVPGMKSEYVVGIAKIQDHLLVLLDIFRILSAAPASSVAR